jgi:hypothetical protein
MHELSANDYGSEQSRVCLVSLDNEAVLAEGSVGSGIFGDESSCVNLVDLRGRFPGESKLDGGAVLATVVVQAKGVGDYQLVRALVDSGSNRFSFISPSGLKRLGLVDCTRKWTAAHGGWCPVSYFG